MVDSLSQSLMGTNQWGIDPEVAKKALQHFRGNLDQTKQELIQNPEKIKKILKKEEEEHQKYHDAWERMEENLGDELDHLDGNLAEEAEYLQQYKKFMNLR